MQEFIITYKIKERQEIRDIKVKSESLDKVWQEVTYEGLHKPKLGYGFEYDLVDIRSKEDFIDEVLGSIEQ